MDPREALRRGHNTINQISVYGGAILFLVAAMGALSAFLTWWLGGATPIIRLFAPMSYVFVAFFLLMVMTASIFGIFWLTRYLAGWPPRPGGQMIHTRAELSAAPELETDDGIGLHINFDWVSTGTNGVRYRFFVSTDKIAKDIVVAVRYATVNITLSGQEWMWSKSKRILERRDVIPGEVLEEEILRRDRVTTENSEDILQILDDKIDLSENKRNPVGVMVMIEISAAADGETSKERFALVFQMVNGTQIIHQLDVARLGWIKDVGRFRR
jgi:hypothetical protein